MKPFDNLDAAKNASVQIKSFSQTETHRGIAWSCTVYFQGKKLGMVSNMGDGGMTRVEFGVDQQQEVVNALKSAGYSLTLNYGESVLEEPETVESWFEFAIPQMGDEAVELNSLKRKAKTNTFVEKRTEPCFASYKAQDTPKTREILQRQLGGDLVRFMNDVILAY